MASIFPFHSQVPGRKIDSLMWEYARRGIERGGTGWFEDSLVKGKMETGELADKDGQ